MVLRLIKSLLAYDEVSKVVLTCNIPEAFSLIECNRVVRVNNPIPRAFSTNHNNAFRHCTTKYFCVLNPDVELPQNPFPFLTSAMQSHSADIIAPLVLAPCGAVEDSARHFPSLGNLILKLLFASDGRYMISYRQPPFEPDWIAGMFMLFHSSEYLQLCGFDEGYFLYYEDVDICRRAKKLGLKILCCPEVSVVHHAQRASRRNFHHMRWHLASMFRYFVKSV